MQPVARIFDSGDNARDAAKKLEAAGYDADTIFVMAPPAAAPAPAPGEDMGDTAAPPPAPTPAAAPKMSADELAEHVSAAGDIPETRAILLSRALENGKSVVVAAAPYGYVARANSIMDDCGAAPVETLDTARPDNPSPFSDLIGMPCIENRLSFLSSDNPLKDPHWTLFPVQLKDKLTFNVKLSDNPAPFSSKLGLKTLSKEKSWRTSFGFKLLTNQQD